MYERVIYKRRPVPTYPVNSDADARVSHDECGRIVEKNGKQWKFYDSEGKATCVSGKDVTTYYFGSHGLESVLLPGGMRLRYEYARHIDGLNRPAAKYRNGELVNRYEWHDHGRLAAWHEMITKRAFAFEYGSSNWLSEVLYHTGTYYALPRFTVRCSAVCDGEGSPKSLRVEEGADLYQGQIIWRDTEPARGKFQRLHLPIGLASGLLDLDTGCVRLGAVDYFSELGVFMAMGRYEIEQSMFLPESEEDFRKMLNLAPFKEEEHPRDGDGKFTSKGGGSGGGAKAEPSPVDDIQEMETGAGPDTGGAGAGGRGAASSSVEERDKELHEQIRKAHGDEVLELYKKREALREKAKAAEAIKEGEALAGQIDDITGKINILTSYAKKNSQGFRGEQRLLALKWRLNLTQPGMVQKYHGLMQKVEAAPLSDRKELVIKLFSELARDAGMPQTKIVTLDFASNGFGHAGMVSTGKEVLVDQKDFMRENIDWKHLIIRFFHEQGHEWMHVLADGRGTSAYPEDVKILRHARDNYIKFEDSSEMYHRDLTEQHAGTFEDDGLNTFIIWKKQR